MESLPSINSGVFTELLIPELWSVKKSSPCYVSILAKEPNFIFLYIFFVYRLMKRMRF